MCRNCVLHQLGEPLPLSLPPSLLPSLPPSLSHLPSFPFLLFHPFPFHLSRQHIFRIHTHLATAPVASLKIKLTFATPSCIDDAATVSLYQLKALSGLHHDAGAADSAATPLGEEEGELPWFLGGAEMVCGPLRVKPFVDVTGQSLQLSLSHPSLLLSTPSPTLLLCFDSLFVDDYYLLTEEVLKNANETTKTDSKPRLRHMRSRILRRLPAAKLSIVPHSILHVTVYTQRRREHSCSYPRQLLRCVFEGELVSRLVLLACAYKVEQEEYSHLPQPVREMLTCEREEVKVEDRVRALEVLCWLASSAFCDANR